MTAAAVLPRPDRAIGPRSVADLIAASGWDATVILDDTDRERMHASRDTLARVAATRPVYGVTRGFGPLVDHPADPDPVRHAAGLLNHLCVGQGPELPPEVVRTMVWLRLAGMRRGHSGVDPAVWAVLARQWNAGFTPAVPSDGSLSASGDLIPLAHAALATAGEREALTGDRDGWVRRPAAAVLDDLGLPRVGWEARSALAFVNGTSASLAVALHGHARLAALTRAAAEVTGRLVVLVGASVEAYADGLAAVRGHSGQRRAARWIRSAIGAHSRAAADRPLQEPYSLRCAPQVLGAVLDQLRLQGEVLVTEASGCTDNPVLVDGTVLHGGNFHAAPVALAVEQLTLCAHQVAYLAERQLALVVDPHRNGGRSPFLTPTPGRASGLAGVQMAATAHLAAIRQHAYPASLTPISSNLGNQDHVPMALNGANALTGVLERVGWIVGSAYLAVNQFGHLATVAPPGPPESALWRDIADRVPPLIGDRPLANEVRDVAGLVEHHFREPRAAGAGSAP